MTDPATSGLLDGEVARRAALVSCLSDFRLLVFICLAVTLLLGRLAASTAVA